MPVALVLALSAVELTQALPSAANAWSWLSLTEPAAILDRIDGAGLHLAEPARFAMRGASWTQNTFAVDGVDVTDPLRGGMPLFDPDLALFERIDVVAARAPVPQGTAGVALALVPRDPSADWRASLAAAATGGGLQASVPGGGAPAVARFGSLLDTTLVVAGPIGKRLGLLVAARGATQERFEREDAAGLDARVLSGTAELVYRLDEGQSLRVLAAGQALRRPFAGRALFFEGGREEGVRVYRGRTIEELINPVPPMIRIFMA